jgi:N-methylhydantoinase B
MKIDPITFAVVKNGLDSIADEMAYTVVRIARSEIVKDVMDFSAALCAADGQMVAQAKTIAQHLGAIPEAMESVLTAFADDLHDGDVVIMNDPYHGGMHLPDIFMFVPIFHGGVRRAFAVVICHHTDVGGRVPGSNASDSTEIYQEGLRMPPLKLYERGVINRTLEKLIRINVRVPDRVLGDLAAQYAATQVGRRGLEKLMQRYGADELDAYMQELLDYAERMTRQEIMTWPRGTWRFTDHIDNDGLSDAPIPISVAITVRGDGTLAVDYSGSSPQVRGALNSTLSFTRSLTYLSVRCVLAKDIPNNVGLFRCIDVTAPEASILNPAMPGACAARALTGYRVFDTMLGALAQIVPDKVPAAGEGGNSVICISGLRPNREPFIIVDMICGAWGGRPDKDGLEAVTNASQNLSNMPVEVMEAEHPVRIEEYAFVTDSCGAGRSPARSRPASCKTPSSFTSRPALAASAIHWTGRPKPCSKTISKARSLATTPSASMPWCSRPQG